MRRPHPARELQRRRRARARVEILDVPQSEQDEDGAATSQQSAVVSLPERELDRLWTPEYLERLARTYWRFLTRVSLGLLRVLYTADSREVVLLTRPFVLLRFKAPEYDFAADRGTVRWPIDRGLLVARRRRGRGFLRLSVRRLPDDNGPDATVAVPSEVVNFYPTIAARFGSFFYDQTQLRVHVIVTKAFLRSLAKGELEPSVVGPPSPAPPQPSPAACPDGGEP